MYLPVTKPDLLEWITHFLPWLYHIFTHWKFGFSGPCEIRRPGIHINSPRSVGFVDAAKMSLAFSQPSSSVGFVVYEKKGCTSSSSFHGRTKVDLFPSRKGCLWSSPSGPGDIPGKQTMAIHCCDDFGAQVAWDDEGQHNQEFPRSGYRLAGWPCHNYIFWHPKKEKPCWKRIINHWSIGITSYILLLTCFHWKRIIINH